MLHTFFLSRKHSFASINIPMEWTNNGKKYHNKYRTIYLFYYLRDTSHGCLGFFIWGIFFFNCEVNFDRFKHNTEFYFLLSTKLNNEITWLVAIVPDHHYGKLNWALYFCMRYDIRVNILMGNNVKITGEIPCVQTCIMKAFHYAIIVSNLNL